MSNLENALQGLMATGEETAVTVAKELLNQKSAIMHTHIHNASLMIGLDSIRCFAASVMQGKGLAKVEALYDVLHNGNVIYPISEGRKRAGEMVKVLEAQMALLGQQEVKEKGSWLGGRNK